MVIARVAPSAPGRDSAAARTAVARRTTSRVEYGRWPAMPPGTGTSASIWSTSPVVGSSMATVPAGTPTPAGPLVCARAGAVVSAPAAARIAAAARRRVGSDVGRAGTAAQR
jgi:hypothetical protein